MNEIKSKKAEEYIKECVAQYHRNDIPSEQALIAIHLAETELSERHAKEMQELRDKAIESYCATKCTMIDGEERCKAPCNPLKLFTKQLTEITINK